MNKLEHKHRGQVCEGTRLNQNEIGLANLFEAGSAFMMFTGNT